MAIANAMFTITDTGDLSGRNLLQRSFFTKEPWTGPTYNAVGDGFGTYHDKYCLPVTTKYLYSNTHSGKDNLFPDLAFEEGVRYTVSGKWAQFRTDTKYNRLYLRIHHTDGTNVTAVQSNQNNVWSSFKLTSTAGKTVDKITMTYGEYGTTYIAGFKLEVGAAATDWTPAPEDVNDAYITANYSKDEIDGLEVGGRNLILKGDEEHTSTVTTEGANAFIPSYSFSLYGQPLAHDEGQTMTISFEYESSGNSLDTGRIYVQHNGTQIASTQNANIYLNTAPSGRYIRTYTITSDQAASTSNNYVRVYIVACSAGTVVTVKNMKVELGNRVTDWTPAPEDTDAAIADVDEKVDAADTKASTALETATGAVTALNDYIAGNEIVVGTQTAATNAWTGKAGFSELVNGQGIAYWLPYAGTSTAATLKLTLADNSETAAIPVYYKGTTRATTHFTAGTVVHLTYRENADVAGTTVEKGWWADASYDSGNTNYYDRIQLNNTIKAKSAISASHFIVSDDGGYFHLAGGSVFDITKPILWCSTAMSAGGTGSNNYISLPSLTLRNNASGITLTANKTCYLVGTLAGKMFTVKSSGFFTSTVPTSDDGYYYISLGYLYSTYQIYLYPEHPIYKFVNGSFKSLNQVAYEASVTAESKNSVYYQATAPTGNLKDGDTWFDTDNDYKISRWDGSTWAAAELGDSAVANLSASKLIAGSVMGNIVLGGTIQAGGSDVGQDGKVLVKDASDVEVASLSKVGLVATAGTIGGWTIDESSLKLSVPYTYDNSGDQVIAHGDDTDLIQVEDAQLVGGSEDDDANISLLTLGRDQSDGIPYILCDDGTLDGSQVRIKNGKISCLKNDNTLTNGISTYIQSDAVLLSESSTINNVTQVHNVRLKSDKVEVLYTPDYEHPAVDSIKRARLEYNDLSFLGDSANPMLAYGIAHWSVFASEKTIKDTLKVSIYHCGNLFWAHFDGTIPAGWTAANTQNVFIPLYADDTDLSYSALIAPPRNITKYIIPTDLTNMRISVTVRSDGQLGISRIAEPFKGNATTTIAGYMETCDIFWAHIG